VLHSLHPVHVKLKRFTLPEISIAPEKGWLKTSFLLGWPISGGYVSFRKCNTIEWMHAWNEMTWNEMTRHQSKWNEKMGEWNKCKIMLLLFALHMCMVFIMFFCKIGMNFKSCVLKCLILEVVIVKVHVATRNSWFPSSRLGLFEHGRTEQWICFFQMLFRKTRWRFQRILELLPPKISGKWSNLTSIFFNWGGSTTN